MTTISSSYGAGSADALELLRNKRQEREAFSLTETFLSTEGVEVEDKATDAEQQSSGFHVRSLTPEEERRLEQLRDMLDGILLEMGDEPTGAQKRRIREIEKEMSEITGVEIHTKLSSGLNALDRDTSDEDEESGDQAAGLPDRTGFMLDQSIARRSRPDAGGTSSGNGIMNFMQEMASTAYNRQAAATGSAEVPGAYALLGSGTTFDSKV